MSSMVEIRERLMTFAAADDVPVSATEPIRKHTAA